MEKTTKKEILKNYIGCDPQLFIKYQGTSFDADSAVVDVTNNTITIPDHLWVTGERLKYKRVGTALSAVGIATTSFAGVGATNYLPEYPFVIKIDADTISIVGDVSKLPVSDIGVSAGSTFVDI